MARFFETRCIIIDNFSLCVILGDQLDVILVGQNYDFDRQNLYNLTSDNKDQFISGIMLADFDGDLSIDILVCINQTSESRITLEVVWGNKSSE